MVNNLLNESLSASPKKENIENNFKYEIRATAYG